jgi:hypothetical protein
VPPPWPRFPLLSALFPSRLREGPNRAAAMAAVSPSCRRCSPRARARAPTVLPLWLRFPPFLCGFPLALARGPQPCSLGPADLPPSLRIPFCSRVLRGLCSFSLVCGFPLALARGPQPCPAVAAVSPVVCRFPLALARGPQPCSLGPADLPPSLRIPFCSRVLRGLCSFSLVCGFPLALARGPQPCRRHGCGFPRCLQFSPRALPPWFSPRARARAPTVLPLWLRFPPLCLQVSPRARARAPTVIPSRLLTHMFPVWPSRKEIRRRWRRKRPSPRGEPPAKAGGKPGE